MKIVLHILDWGGDWLRAALDEELWEATFEKFGMDEAMEIFNDRDATIEVDGDYFIVSVGGDVCRCCGKGNKTLTPCPKCKELLCQDCERSVHICQPE